MHFYLVCMTSLLCEGVGWVGEGTNSTKTPSFYHFLQLQGSESSEKKKSQVVKVLEGMLCRPTFPHLLKCD